MSVERFVNHPVSCLYVPDSRDEQDSFERTLFTLVLTLTDVLYQLQSEGQMIARINATPHMNFTVLNGNGHNAPDNSGRFIRMSTKLYR